MRADTIAEQLFFVTAHVSARDGTRSWVGTGFIYAVESTVGTLHFLVTNKHVLQGAHSLTIQMVRGSEGVPVMGQAATMTVSGFNDASWVGHPQPEVDVGVMVLGGVLNAMVDAGETPFFRALTPELFPSPEALRDLDAIEDVTFVGYPSGLFDRANFVPIARRGTAATPLQLDYEGLPAFLIDASVFPGSSGSPVLLFDRGFYAARDGGTVVGSRFSCLGVLAAVHVRQVAGKVSQLPSRLAVSFDEPIDLGIVYKALTINTCVDEALRRVGAGREPVSTPTQPDEITEADRDVGEKLPPEM